MLELTKMKNFSLKFWKICKYEIQTDSRVKISALKFINTTSSFKEEKLNARNIIKTMKLNNNILEISK